MTSALVAFGDDSNELAAQFQLGLGQRADRCEYVNFNAQYISRACPQVVQIPASTYGSVLAGQALAQGAVHLVSGKTAGYDGGAGLLYALAGIRDKEEIPDKTLLAELLEICRERLKGRVPQLVYTDEQPLLGAQGAIATAGLDVVQARELTGFVSLLEQAAPSSLLAQAILNGHLPGSSAAGGAGTVIKVLGGQLVSGAQFLGTQLALADRLQKTDLVAFVSSKFDDTDIFFKYLRDLALELALPLVVLTEETFLTRPERISAGISQIHLGGNPKILGSIFGRTWLR